jgi:hypothetical protein
VERLNEKLTTDEICDNRLNLFQLSAVNLFIDEYKKQNTAFPITFIAFKYGEKETVAKFYGNNCILLGKRDIKFYDGRLHLGLIMSVKCPAHVATDIKRRIRANAVFLGMETASSPGELEKALKKIMAAMGYPPLVPLSTNKVVRPDSRTESRFRSKTEGDKK